MPEDNRAVLVLVSLVEALQKLTLSAIAAHDVLYIRGRVTRASLEDWSYRAREQFQSINAALNTILPPKESN